MNNYTIYCTPEQTQKALKLGAPIEIKTETVGSPNILFGYNRNIYTLPTAEQMIGWLEKLINFIDVIRQEDDTWLYIVYFKNNSNKNITVKGFSSRKEATLAAIDVAMEYLTDNKLIK